jgi:hypothetical protein
VITGLTTDLLNRACRTFLEQAYPGGEPTIASNRRVFLAIPADVPLADWLAAQPLCERLRNPAGGLRGYALRLGSSQFPHIKLQVTEPDHGSACVFAVDTHDALRCAVSPEEAQAWTRLQCENRKLKERIELAWEKQGLLTFNGLLRQGLEKK